LRFAAFGWFVCQRDITRKVVDENFTEIFDCLRQETSRWISGGDLNPDLCPDIGICFYFL